jgi:hypothetical protein
MKPICVRKGPFGYYVDDSGRDTMNVAQLRVAPGDASENSQRCPLHVKLALEGAEVKFDASVPMVLTDNDGRKLRVTFTDKITEVVDLAEPDKVLEHFDVGIDNIFWFIVAGVPEQ